MPFQSKRLSSPIFSLSLFTVAQSYSMLSFAQTPVDASSRVDEVVVTATRNAQRLGDIAASVEVITAQDFQEITGAYLTDVLKKGASVDVIEYPGGLSVLNSPAPTSAC